MIAQLGLFNLDKRYRQHFETRDPLVNLAALVEIEVFRPRLRSRPKAKVEIAIPVFGYKNQFSIDRAHGSVRRYAVTDAAANDGMRLPRR